MFVKCRSPSPAKHRCTSSICSVLEDALLEYARICSDALSSNMLSSNMLEYALSSNML